jgi:branched-chain amino acid transport system permease protein
LHIAIIICITGVLTSSFNVISGYAGQLSLCHGVLFGLGSYCSAILALRLNLPFWVVMPASAIFVTVFATALIGIPSLRTRGLYFALATLGFQLIVYTIFVHWVKVTNGPAGITGIPEPALFGIVLKTRKAFYPFAFAVLLINLFSMYLLASSRVGLEWRSIQQDEQAARSLGVDSFRIKLLAFVICNFWAGVAGSLNAYYIGYISPDMFGSAINLGVVLMALAGGMRTVLGPIIGTLLFVSVPELLRELELYRLVIFGLSLILLVIFVPQGIVGSLGKLNFFQKNVHRRYFNLEKEISPVTERRN